MPTAKQVTDQFDAAVFTKLSELRSIYTAHGLHLSEIILKSNDKPYHEIN